MAKTASFFAQHGYQVTAVDFSATALNLLEQTRQQYPDIPLFSSQTDITRLEYPAHSVDVIYANLSLHYFDDAMTTNIFLFCILCYALVG